jgi:sugar phosphate isomerase/epimerase
MKAIIGYTGFVGSHIKDNIDLPCDFYNSKNIHEIIGKEYEIVYFAGLPATKWMINKEPEKDINNMLKIQQYLSKASIQKFVLISTIDVYDKNKQLQDEKVTKVTEESYGKHRFIMEEWVKINYDDYHIIRLPALFGVGLKKNIIYDLLNINIIDYNYYYDVKNILSTISPFTFFQWYDINDLITDINYTIKKNIQIINLFSETILTLDLIKECFPNYTNYIKNNASSPIIYNYKTNFYIKDKNTIFTKLNKYIQLHNKIKKAQNRLVVSNIAWNIEWEDLALDILKKYNINCIEMAISKYMDLNIIDFDKVFSIKDKFDKYNMQVYSLQAIFYGLDENDYNVFINPDKFINHFKSIINYANVLEATRIVFGSPRHRRVPDNMPIDFANKQFIKVMHELAEYASHYNVIICLEPNAIEYRCNYITNITDAIYIINQVCHPNFQLNFDTGNAIMENDINKVVISDISNYILHSQVSLPFLEEIKDINDDDIVHNDISLSLQKIETHISLEMKEINKYSDFVKNIQKFISIYG